AVDRRGGAMPAHRRACDPASCDTRRMRSAGPPQGSNSAPAGGSAAAEPQAWGDHPTDDSQNSATTNAQTQRLAALGFMVAGVCHEVSNPLAAVHSMLQIL